MDEVQEPAAWPSGRQLSIGDGQTRATVTEVGAGLRELEIAGEAVLWPYPVGEMASGGRGQVLAPWPNRVEDGTYTFGTVSAQAPLDEPDRRNAIHGLVRWLKWDVDEQGKRSVALSCLLAPQPAYPWRLRLGIRYEVLDGGLVVHASATNESPMAAPYGMGLHPYLDAGPGGVDGCTLTLAADRRLVLDERGIPQGSAEVAGTTYDFAGGGSLTGVRLDDCFTGLSGPAGHVLPAGAAWEAVLSSGSGRRSGLWADGAWGYVMVYTGDTLAPDEQRRGVAIEPMTCPPNAFRSGQSVVTLAPGGRWEGRFGIRLVD
ncbi:MAG TPA: aldose 1-epimerase family protein [Acidimicrobiales bacterium]|nr:aldose 1-epimerase family protein [Acidimicrobiales bacterium]